MRSLATSSLRAAVRVSLVPSWTLVLLSSLSLLASCGRTGLDGGEPCQGEGTVRSCTGTCGPGVEVCSDGLWGACTVKRSERPCSDPCGSGTEACIDGQWQGCVVPRMT